MCSILLQISDSATAYISIGATCVLVLSWHISEIMALAHRAVILPHIW